MKDPPEDDCQLCNPPKTPPGQDQTRTGGSAKSAKGHVDSLNTSIAHTALGVVAARSLTSTTQEISILHPGMHANFLVHGVLGFVYYQSGKFGIDVSNAYGISNTLARYLPLPCLMAKLYSDNMLISAIHLISGLVPASMALAGHENVQLGNIVIALNLFSLCVYSLRNNRNWGWFTAGSGLFAYFVSPHTGNTAAYPLSLALMQYCGTFNADFKGIYGISYSASRYLALPCLMADLYRSNNGLSAIHLISGLIPFAMALGGNDNAQLGNLMIACNIVSLCHYSMTNNREWGWYTAGAGLFTYFVSPQAGTKIAYPLGLALMQYCAYRVFHSHVDAANAPPRR